jgi:hypothetical protein
MSFDSSVSSTVVLWRKRPVSAQKEALRESGAATTMQRNFPVAGSRSVSGDHNIRLNTIIGAFRCV